MRQHAPLGSHMHQPAQGVIDLAQGILALQGVLALQTQIRGGERPFVVVHILILGRVGCAYARHTRSTLPLLMIKALEFQYQPAEGDELEPRARGTAPGQAIRRFVLPRRTVSPTLRGTAGA